MKVNIKELSVNMEIKNRGIELDVYDNDGSRRGAGIVDGSSLPASGEYLWSRVSIMNQTVLANMCLVLQRYS